MPVTPLHWGPSLLLGLLALRYIDFPALMAASVAPDIRTALVFFGMIGGPLHGIFTTYTGGTVVALVTAALIIPVRSDPRVMELMDLLGLDQEVSNAKIVAGSLVGVYSHVTLDAILYADVRPFYPLAFNPLLDMVSVSGVYLFTMVCFLTGFMVYIWMLSREEFWS